jgi:hypothetical protein
MDSIWINLGSVKTSVQNPLEHLYSEGVILDFSTGFQNLELVDDFFSSSSILFHSFKFAKGFFDLIFFCEIFAKVHSEFKHCQPF